MPRALLVPGDPGVATALTHAGWIVRTIGPAPVAGARDHVPGDPTLLGPLLPALASVTVVAWLHGDSPDPELHDVRLTTLCEKLVDSPVRGLVYESARATDPARGLAVVADAARRWNIPVRVIAARADAVGAITALGSR